MNQKEYMVGGWVSLCAFIHTGVVPSKLYRTGLGLMDDRSTQV